MFATNDRSYLRMLIELILAAFVILAVGSLLARAQQPAPSAPQNDEATVEPGEPILREYRGVKLGMPAEEVRRKLGEPADKSDQQDFYLFSETESAQIFYDASGLVRAFSVHYSGDAAAAPAPKTVLGTDVQPRPDGSIHRRVSYRRGGCWVSYSRTAGDSPLVTISVRQEQPPQKRQ